MKYRIYLGNGRLLGCRMAAAVHFAYDRHGYKGYLGNID
jgi:hypothetical protein